MKKTIKILIIDITIVLLFLLLLLIPTTKVLSISNRKNEAQKYFLATNRLNGFCIAYTHSVNKGRVKDYYSFTDDNNLKLERTVFVSYGAGIPEPEETPGAIFKVIDSGYEISNINRVVPRLTMAVGIIANHSISFIFQEQTEEQFLTDFFAPQTSIILELKRVSLIEYISHKL